MMEVRCGLAGEFEAYDAARPYRKIVALVVHSGLWIDGLQVQFDDKDVGGGSWRLHGAHHHNNRTFHIPEHVYLTKITGEKGGEYVHQLQFHLSDGQSSPLFGSSPGIPFEYTAEEGEVICGIRGAYGGSRGHITSLSIISGVPRSNQMPNLAAAPRGGAAFQQEPGAVSTVPVRVCLIGATQETS